MSKLSDEIIGGVKDTMLDPVWRSNLLTHGEIFWVLEDSDTDFTKIQAEHPLNVFTTVSAAYDACTTNRNDIILISANTAHTMAAMLTVSKNRIHFIGMDGGGRQTGHGSRLVMGVTTAATDIAVVKVTGVRNSFTNIKIESSNTVAQGLYALVDAGEYTCYQNCSFLKLTDLDQTTAADVVAEGDSTTWRNCEFGAATVLVSVARPTMLIDKIVGSSGMLDNNFFECNFVKYTSSADAMFIKVAAAGDGQRYAMLRSCAFINWSAAAGGTTMTNAISSPTGSELMIVLDANCISAGCTNIASSTTNVQVFINAAVPTAATSGISVNAA